MDDKNNHYIGGGDYVYNPAYGERFFQTPGYLIGKSLNKTLDRMQDNPETITNEDMVNVKGFLANLFVCIDDLSNSAPNEAGSLTNMLCGIIAKLKNLYDSHGNAFIRTVNEINNEEDKVNFKEILHTYGINVD